MASINEESSNKYTLTPMCGSYQCVRNLCGPARQLAEPRSQADVDALTAFWGLTGESAWLGFNHLNSTHYRFHSDGSLVNSSFPYIGLNLVPYPRHSWMTMQPIENADQQCGILYGGLLAAHSCAFIGNKLYGICEPLTPPPSKSPSESPSKSPSKSVNSALNEFGNQICRLPLVLPPSLREHLRNNPCEIFPNALKFGYYHFTKDFAFDDISFENRVQILDYFKEVLDSAFKDKKEDISWTSLWFVTPMRFRKLLDTVSNQTFCIDFKIAKSADLPALTRKLSNAIDDALFKSDKATTSSATKSSSVHGYTMAFIVLSVIVGLSIVAAFIYYYCCVIMKRRGSAHLSTKFSRLNDNDESSDNSTDLITGRRISKNMAKELEYVMLELDEDDSVADFEDWFFKNFHDDMRALHIWEKIIPSKISMVMAKLGQSKDLMIKAKVAHINQIEACYNIYKPTMGDESMAKAISL